MQTIFKFTLLVAIAGVLLLPGLASADDWQKISDDDGITVFQKKDAAEGTGVSFRGETILASNTEDILRVMADNSKAHRWIPLVVSRRNLQKISNDERIEYTHVSMPWPLADRYFINRAKVERLPEGLMRVFVQSIENPDQALLESGKVLGFLYYSELMLTPIEGGAKTRMVIEINSDPKGLIPKFLVNASQRSWPRKFFKGLTVMLEEAGALKTSSLDH